MRDIGGEAVIDKEPVFDAPRPIQVTIDDFARGLFVEYFRLTTAFTEHPAFALVDLSLPLSFRKLNEIHNFVLNPSANAVTIK
jgi:hypothetical protein